MPSLALPRWIFRVTRLALLAHLVPRALAVLFVIVELDAIVDWRALARQGWSAPPSAIWLVVAGACLLIGADARPFVDATLRGPRLAVLRRQPIGATAWGAASLVLTVPNALWLGILAAFLTGVRPGPMLLWTGLAVASVSAGTRTGRLGAGVAAGLVAAAAHATGGALLWALATWAAVIPLSGRVLLAHAQDRPAAAPAPSPLRPRSPLGALVHRDGALLWRAERSLVAAFAGSALVVGLAAGAMYRTGDWASPALTAGVIVLLAPASISALSALSAVARRLGRRFDPPEWPVSASQRAWALATLVGGLLAPSWAAAAVTAPRLGLGHLPVGAFVAAVACGAAWWVAARPLRPNGGSWPYWLFAATGAALGPYAVLTPPLAPVAGALAAGLLARYALARASAALEASRGRP